eukprot:11196728-Lingulodinium_polyedra.AAC.1
MRAGKIQGTSTILMDQAKKKVEDELLENMIKALKDSPPLRWTLKAIIDGKSELAAGEKLLPRGARRVYGSNASNGVPHYAIIEALSKITKIDKADLNKMDDLVSNTKALLCFAIGASRDMPMPALNMPLSAFYRWVAERHAALGARLKDFSLSSSAIDWQRAVGCFAFIKPMGKTTWCRILHRRSGSIKDLPE